MEKLKNFLKPNWKKIIIAIVLNYLGIVLLFLVIRFFSSCFCIENYFKGPVRKVSVEEVIKKKPYCRLVRGDHFFAQLIENFGWQISEDSFFLIIGLLILAFPFFFFYSLMSLFTTLLFYLPWISFFYLISCFIFSKFGKNK